MIAYKRLLVNLQVAHKKGANTLPLEDIEILYVPSSTKKAGGTCYPGELPEQVDDPEDEDFDFVLLSTESSWFVDDVVSYISGFVSRAVSRLSRCAPCCDRLFGDHSFSRFRDAKNEGGMVKASVDVINICKVTEKYVRCLQPTDFINPTEFHILSVSRGM